MEKEELEFLEKAYNMTINAAVALNSQWIFCRGDMQIPIFQESLKRLKRICEALNLTLDIIRDGEDAILFIKTSSQTLVLQITMNLITFEDEIEIEEDEEENDANF